MRVTHPAAGWTAPPHTDTCRHVAAAVPYTHPLQPGGAIGGKQQLPDSHARHEEGRDQRSWSQIRVPARSAAGAKSLACCTAGTHAAAHHPACRQRTSVQELVRGQWSCRPGLPGEPCAPACRPHAVGPQSIEPWRCRNCICSGMLCTSARPWQEAGSADCIQPGGARPASFWVTCAKPQCRSIELWYQLLRIHGRRQSSVCKIKQI